MIIGLLGDLEGDVAWAESVLRTLGQRGDVDTVVQVGDLRFGMGERPEAYLAALDAACAAAGLRMVGINGNHENWALLDELWADPANRGADGARRPLQVAGHVTLLPPGHRWELGGRSFVALGGAPSVNRLRLTEGVDWWPTEVVTEDDVAVTLAGGPVDVAFTHDSPAPPFATAPVAEIVHGNPNDWPPEILAEADDGMEKVTRAVLGVRPRLLVHGHFHVAGEAVVRLPGAVHATRIWSLGANGDPAGVRLLDLTTLTDPT